jgi:hypothetical protein
MVWKEHKRISSIGWRLASIELGNEGDKKKQGAKGKYNGEHNFSIQCIIFWLCFTIIFGKS